MVMVKCQHSGIEFEAKSKQTKQHPIIAKMKVDSNKAGNYREVLNALDAVQKAGGYTTVAEYVQLVEDYMAGKEKRAAEHVQRRIEAEEKGKVKEAEFKAWLPANGYTTRTVTYDRVEEDPYADPQNVEGLYRTVTHTDTFLVAPDGKDIDRFNARFIFEGKLTLEIVRQREDEKAAKDAGYEAEQEARETAHEESLQEFKTVLAQIQRTAKQVKRFEFPKESELVARVKMGKSYYRHQDRIRKAQVNSVDVWEIVSGSGYDDDGYYSYYCADVEKAGLETTH